MSKWVVLFAMVFSFSGLQASETVKGAKKDYEAFKQEMNLKIEAAEKKIAELKMKAKEKSSVAQEKTIQELESTRDELKTELNKVEADSKTGWQKFKKAFAASVDNLNTKVQKALAE